MGHYAFLNENNIVVEVITGRNENDIVEGISDWEEYYGDFRGLSCKRASYNTYKGEHLNDGLPFRKNFPSPGYSYDEIRDAFIPPKPYNSWILNEDTCHWDSPSPHPQPVENKTWIWVEEDLNWQLIESEV